MTRKKVKLAFINNDSARKATFKKRKKGLMKKVSELSTLCGIDACAIVYSPYESQPEVWPDPRGAQRVLTQFKRMPEMEQSKKMVNQEGFIRQRIAKAAEQLKKLHKDNREKEITQLMYQCLTGKGLQGLVMADFHDMGWLLDQNLKEIYKRIEVLKKGEAEPPQGLATVQAMQEQKPTAGDHLSGMCGMQNHHQRPQWMAEWMNNTASDHHQQMTCMFRHGGDEMMMPFNDTAAVHSAMWSNSFFP